MMTNLLHTSDYKANVPPLSRADQTGCDTECENIPDH